MAQGLCLEGLPPPLTLSARRRAYPTPPLEPLGRLLVLGLAQVLVLALVLGLVLALVLGLALAPFLTLALSLAHENDACRGAGIAVDR